MTVASSTPSSFTFQDMLNRAAAKEAPPQSKAPCDCEPSSFERRLSDFDEAIEAVNASRTDSEIRLEQENMMEARVAMEIVALLSKKNIGYGRNLPRHGLKGVVIRMVDKIQRLENLVLGNASNEVNESVEETLVDLAGYAIKTLALMRLGDMELDGNWKYHNGLEGFVHQPKQDR